MIQLIKWKSLIGFIITLVAILAVLSGGFIFAFNKVMDKIAEKHPEVNLIPSGHRVYIPDENLLKNYKEQKDRGYLVMLPADLKMIQSAKSENIEITDAKRNIEIDIQPKLYRFDDSIKSTSIINNPDGDYKILLGEIFNAKDDPLLLFQKMSYLPSGSSKIEEIQTPLHTGYIITAEDEYGRTELYKLFDNYYWHNINVYINKADYPHNVIETIISTIKNDDDAQETAPGEENTETLTE